MEKENAELKKRIEEFEQLLGMNSKNSSKPTSFDPLGTPVVQPRRLHKKHGTKKGPQMQIQ